MLAFMRANYRSWPALNGNPGGPCYAGAPTDDLNYDSQSKTALGVNYGACHGWEREYAYNVVRWMSLKVGTNRRKFSNGVILKEPTPFMVYDGHETWPLIVTSNAKVWLPKKLQMFAIDPLGIPNGPNAFSSLIHLVEFSLSKAFRKATKIVGPCPVRGDRLAWRDRLLQAWLTVPEVRAGVDKGLDTMRAELERLDKLWVGT
jgi:hypothetical protein